MWSDNSLDTVLNLASSIEKDVCEDLKGGHVVNEEDFSSALMTHLRMKLNKLVLTPQPAANLSLAPGSTYSYKVNARVLTCKFEQSEENLSGADIIMGFKGNVDGTDINKSVLIQAKLFGGKGKFRSLPDNTEDKRVLFLQCKRMKKITNGACYVFVYSKIGVKFYPASKVISKFPEGLSHADGLDFPEFIYSFFKCNLGDHNLRYLVKGNLTPHLENLGIKHSFLIDLEKE